jgi:hypothetical protein
MVDSPAFKRLYEGGRNKPCSEKECTLHVHTRLPLMLNLSFDVQKSYEDAGMPGKVGPASTFLPFLLEIFEQDKLSF